MLDEGAGPQRRPRLLLEVRVDIVGKAGHDRGFVSGRSSVRDHPPRCEGSDRQHETACKNVQHGKGVHIVPGRVVSRI